MTTRVEKTVVVEVPVSTAYNQWTQFEDFPRFMGGVREVRQLDDQRLHWVAEIAGVRREWQAQILEQTPDRKVAWAATEGATNAGAVTFQAAGPTKTAVTLVLEYEPEGVVEKVGDALNVIEKQATSDLERFKAFIESADYPTGAWRGSVGEGVSAGTPGVQAAAASRGDSGKAGVSGKVVGAAAAAVGAAAAGVLKSRSGGDDAPPADEETSAAAGSDPGYVHPPVTTVEGPTHVSGDAMATGTGSVHPDEDAAAEAVRREGGSSS